MFEGFFFFVNVYRRTHRFWIGIDLVRYASVSFTAPLVFFQCVLQSWQQRRRLVWECALLWWRFMKGTPGLFKTDTGLTVVDGNSEGLLDKESIPRWVFKRVRGAQQWMETREGERQRWKQGQVWLPQTGSNTQKHEVYLLQWSLGSSRHREIYCFVFR